jgi:hypothetical protein
MCVLSVRVEEQGLVEKWGVMYVILLNVIRRPPPTLVHTLCPLSLQTAVDAYGAFDTALWLRYAQHAQRAGKQAGMVYWRAIKALEQPEPFIEEYQLLKLGI